VKDGAPRLRRIEFTRRDDPTDRTRPGWLSWRRI
jgi:hypothetical protein